MVGLDFFIEQNASKFDFWYWKSGIIPIQNYIAWFVIAFLLNLLVQKHLAQKPNLTAKALYFVAISFFCGPYTFLFKQNKT
jgi:putative membrane protein